MKKYYYTFGMDERFPFQGGWTEVIADDINNAHAVFRRKHPDRTPGILNCSDYYTEQQFRKSEMYGNGNLGRKCLEVLFAEEAQDGIFACYRFRINRKGCGPSRGKPEIRMPWWCESEGEGYSDIICYLQKDQSLSDFWDGAYNIVLLEKVNPIISE